MLSRQATELTRLQTRALPAVDSDRLMQSDGQQAYALGTLLGEDIRTAEQTHEALGLTTDRALMLAGVMDGLQARYRLPPATREAAQAALGAARTAAVEQKQAQDARFTAEFRRRPGGQEAPEGFWYLRHPPAADQSPNTGEDRDDGTSGYPDDAVRVALLIRETLTDGTVIQDMETNGGRLIQAVGEFPPLFRAAVRLVKGNGTLTVVAPPALAYGDAGWPPRIPPRATIVYTLTVTPVDDEATPLPNGPADAPVNDVNG